MPLFMFASGYVYIATKKDIGYGSFLLKKIKRLMIPYFSTSFIVISIKLAMQGNMSVDNPVTFFSYLKIFYLPEAGYFLWFIWALWWMFVVVPLFKTKRRRMIFFLFSIIISFIPMNSFLPDIFCILQFKKMLVFFMLGVFAFESKWLKEFLLDFKIWKILMASGMFVLSQLIYNQIDTIKLGGVFFYLNNILLPYIGIFFIFEISNWISKTRFGSESSLLMVISASSYIIYLFHTTFEGFMKAILRKIPLDANLWYIFLPEAIVVILAGIIVPILLYKYILKRYRITKLAFGLKN